MFETKKKYYDDVGILYSFTSNFGDGYMVKRWNRDFDPNIDQPNFGDGMPSAMWSYLDKDFKTNVEFIQARREAMTDSRYSMNFSAEQNLKKQLVTDEAIVAKFALLENDLSYKTQAFIVLEKIKDKINEGECDLEKTLDVLQSLV